MRRPNFGNLESFCNRCAGTNSENITVPRAEAQGIAREYQNLLAYTIDLQAKIMELQSNDVIELEIQSDSF
jgi:hypothetical protein|tara:strand:+ start:517 stop:729 length:213 start_codon:yes stop_codon:yes gene_type:complete